METGCYTAIITPFNDAGIDYIGLEKLVEFQLANGITGIVSAGPTGESPTLTWDEHIKVIEAVSKKINDKCICIAGTGSNNTHESLAATKHAFNAGVNAALLADPYYNGPSSLEIRKEYLEPVAKEFPSLKIVPYVIPGRTGTQLLPEDLALIYREFNNVDTVKEATANIENMRRIRQCCGNDFTILSGDDPLTFEMMTDPAIKAAGVISVISNIAPKAVTDMVFFLAAGKIEEAKNLIIALEPLFNIVTVKTKETSPYGEVICRARNPLAIKSLMALLGMPSGRCRQPLGKMTKNAINIVINAAKSAFSSNPAIFKPIEDFFNVNIEERLNNQRYMAGLCYDEY
jgi:4-hydroxy-tetrahydrodipicolinate synthase